MATGASAIAVLTVAIDGIPTYILTYIPIVTEMCEYMLPELPMNSKPSSK